MKHVMDRVSLRALCPTAKTHQSLLISLPSPTGRFDSLGAIIFWRLTGNLWPDLALFGGGLVVTGIYCWWVKGTQEFAKENPELALLEGAELLEYQKFEAQAKGILLIASSPPIIDPAAP